MDHISANCIAGASSLYKVVLFPVQPRPWLCLSFCLGQSLQRRTGGSKCILIKKNIPCAQIVQVVIDRGTKLGVMLPLQLDLKVVVLTSSWHKIYSRLQGLNLIFPPLTAAPMTFTHMASRSQSITLHPVFLTPFSFLAGLILLDPKQKKHAPFKRVGT